MTCPVCGGKTRVVDTVGDLESVYRIRKCLICLHVFGTIETECESVCEIKDKVYRIKYDRYREQLEQS